MSNLSFGFQRDTDIKIFRVNDTTEWGPELVRADHDLYLFTMQFVDNCYTAVPNSPNLPLAVVNSWTVEAETDGSYMVVMVAAPRWEGIAYAKNALVSDDGKLYRALKTVPVGTAPEDTEYWLHVDRHLCLPLLEGSPNAHLKIDYFLHDAHALICLGEKSIAYSGGKCGCTDECETIKDWAWSMMFYNAAVYSQGFGEFEEAGKFISNVNARCGNEAGKSPCNCN